MNLSTANLSQSAVDRLDGIAVDGELGNPKVELAKRLSNSAKKRVTH